MASMKASAFTESDVLLAIPAEKSTAALYKGGTGPSAFTSGFWVSSGSSCRAMSALPLVSPVTAKPCTGTLRTPLKSGSVSRLAMILPAEVPTAGSA